MSRAENQNVSFSVREATPADLDALLELLPRVGAFPRPEHRSQTSVHDSDANRLRAWANGEARELVVLGAEGAGRLLGLAILSLRPDVFDKTPSSHLEVLAVDEGFEGHGIASALMKQAEALAVQKGARSMSLHVFDTNRRARELYQRRGFRAEWIRYIKPLA